PNSPACSHQRLTVAGGVVVNILELYVAFSLGVAFALAFQAIDGYTSKWIVAVVFVAAFVAWPIMILRGWR
ncbi:MAG: hypothetical protein V4510_12350, partial [bacterium]